MNRTHDLNFQAVQPQCPTHVYREFFLVRSFPMGFYALSLLPDDGDLLNVFESRREADAAPPQTPSANLSVFFKLTGLRPVTVRAGPGKYTLVTHGNCDFNIMFCFISEARGQRYLKNTFGTRMITWAQNVKPETRNGNSLPSSIPPAAAAAINAAVSRARSDRKLNERRRRKKVVSTNEAVQTLRRPRALP